MSILRSRAFRYFLPGLMVMLLSMQACQQEQSGKGKVDTSSEAYRNAVSAFYLGLAAEQTDHLIYAVNQMLRVTRLYPDEPAAWSNLGVMALRQGNFELAQKRLDKAQKLAPENANIEFLNGLMKSRQGNIEEALTHFKKAQQMDPDNVKVKYALAEELQRQDSQANADQVEQLLHQILQKYPKNRAVLIEIIRVAAKNGNQEAIQDAMQELEQLSGSWPKDVQQQFGKVEDAVDAGNNRDITIELTFLKNELQQLNDFQNEVAAVQIPESQIGFMITHFLSLPKPSPKVDPADEQMTFTSQPLTQNAQGSWIRAVSLKGQLKPDILRADQKNVNINGRLNLSYPGGQNENAPPYHGIALLDYNYDFLNDLVFAGEGGFRLLRQSADSTFTDATTETGLPASVVGGSYKGAWSADIDSDGDLDIVLSPTDGPPKVLRNNGDNTFSTLDLFGDVQQPKDFVWADLDSDGDPDGVFIGQDGTLSIYLNNRSGSFSKLQSSSLPTKIKAMNVSDLDRDGVLDLVVVNAQNTIQQISYHKTDASWKVTDVAKSSLSSPERLFINDLDNNGGLDLLVSAPSGSQVWLNKQDSTYAKLSTEIPTYVSSVADVSGNSRLDLVGLSTDSQKPVELINKGTKNYHARIIRPRASGQFGDRRINSFGIGSEIEARTGLMYQKKLVTTPLVHFGLGTFEEAEMLRIIWPNGSVQAEFAELGNSSTITNEQSLKGSCPWLFTYNGKDMEFVTDFIWRSPLGLRINAQTTAGVVQTEDRVKIRGDQLKPRNGYYDVRITAELWETHFFDQVALMAVDHPENTDIFVNERFSFPPPDLKVHPTEHPHSVAKVTDDQGKDVTERVNKRDGKYLHRFGTTKYQGLAKQHYIEIDLGDHLPQKGPLWLLAHGWVRPTDSSINLALSQGSTGKPEGISIQVPDGNGGWVTAKKNLGFPAGKSKTVMIRLDGIFKNPGDHRIRLRTSTETYWDQIRWAQGLPDTQVKRTTVQPEMMKLQYRGYSKVTEANHSSPEIPHYDEITGATQKWRDLVGFYTRYGDISELLKKVDDRYVIMNAGDEMRFHFKALNPPQKGWVRDFVLIGDGWVKDGDYNTVYSKTVLPLPSHKRDTYTKAPSLLKNDPVYQAHKEDWVKYHTRYVTPGKFESAMIFKKND